MCWNGIRSVTFRGVQYVDDLHSVKVDHHSSTGTTRDILDLVCLEGSLGRESKATMKEVAFFILSHPHPCHKGKPSHPSHSHTSTPSHSSHSHTCTLWNDVMKGTIRWNPGPLVPSSRAPPCEGVRDGRE